MLALQNATSRGATLDPVATDEQFAETLKALDNYRIDRIGVSHCTGLSRAAVMHARLKERFFFGSVGFVLKA